MGRSTSCFKIITCGSDSADKDDLEAPEVKGEKKGWSFRKRSDRHRVLSNTAVSEISPPPAKKDAPESAAINFQPPITSDIPEKVFDAPQKVPDVLEKVPNVPQKVPDVPEKVPDVPEKVPDVPEKVCNVSEEISVPQCAEEQSQLPVSEDSKEADPVVDAEIEVHGDSELEESAAILIQTAVRGFLAQKELLKLKNLIKLQAAVRGHLVRRHAVGTLRCVQAIVKMQALVRARRARLTVEGSVVESDVNQKQNEDKKNASTKPAAYISIEKLLSNRFARQLLESTPKEKPILIKCEVSKPNSAWNWLERWMSASAAEQSAEPSPNSEQVTDQQTSEKDESFASQEVENENPHEVLSKSVAAVSSTGMETTDPSESEDNMITYDTDKVELRECQSENVGTSEEKESPLELNAGQSQPIIVAESSEVEAKPPHVKPEEEIEEPKRSMKRSASEELENDGKKSSFGSRKATNPAFIAAQSKFEELSSVANSSEQMTETVVNVEEEDSVTETKEFDSLDNSTNDQPRVQVMGSECETELSISSTLDSPEHYGSVAVELENVAKVPEETVCSSSSVTLTEENLETKDSTTAIPPPVLPHVTNEPIESTVVTESHEQNVKPVSESELREEVNSETVQQAYVCTPEASPRSHMTVPESQGTPASQVSVNTKGSRPDKSTASHKRKSLSTSKKSPSHLYNDSGSSSTKQSSKDQKSGKRRNSFGTAKSENVDHQEPRESSSSSSSIPHFMQATESAKAKLNANNSPRSSPDVQDREIYVKKRQSLPVANGRQGSPHIQRSTSQAQQGTKANGAPVQERKWLR